MNTTFSESFCARFNILPEKFAQEVLNRSLYPHARLVKWLLVFYDAYYFASDYELVLSAGTLRRLRDFSHEAARFNVHPANRGFLRRKWLLRISTKKLRLVVMETLVIQKEKVGRMERNYSAVPFTRPTMDFPNLKSRHATGVHDDRTVQI